MTVDFNGKNHRFFYQSDIYLVLGFENPKIPGIQPFHIKEMLTTIWYLNMVKVQIRLKVVELLLWEKCGILVDSHLLNLHDKYESFIFTAF